MAWMQEVLKSHRIVKQAYIYTVANTITTAAVAVVQVIQSPKQDIIQKTNKPPEGTPCVSLLLC